MTSSLITDYLGYGTHAARPASPNIPSTAIAFYYETDTSLAFVWSGSAWVQLTASAPSIVQSAFNAGTGITSVTMGATPTNGNLLVGFSLGDNTGPGTGWSKPWFIDNTGIGSTGIYWKIAGAGESTTQTPISGGLTCGLAVIETTPAVPGPPDYHVNNSTSNTLNASAFAGSDFIIGVVGSENSNNLPTSLSGGTLTAGSASGSSRSIQGFSKSSPATGLGANAITSNFSSGNSIRMAAMSLR